jgi:hypothetical protein
MHHRNNKWETWGLESPLWDRAVGWLKNALLVGAALASGYAIFVMAFCM